MPHLKTALTISGRLEYPEPMQENLYKDLLDAAPWAWARHRFVRDGAGAASDYVFLEVNRTFCEMTGFVRDAIIDRPVSQVIPGIRTGGFDWVAHYDGIVRSGQPVEFEQYVQALDKWFRVKVLPGEDDTFTTFFVDITREHARIDELDRFFSVNLDLLCIADLEGNFIKINAAWEDILGYTVGELTGKRFLDFVHPDDMAATLDAMSTLAGQNDVLNFTNRYRCRDGSWRWIEWRSHPHGKLIYAAARDITERVSKQALIESLSRQYELVFDGTLDAIFLVQCCEDGAWRYVRTNRAHQNDTGIDGATINGKTPQELLGDALGNAVAASYDRCLAGNRPVTYEESPVLPAGQRTWLTTLTPACSSDGTRYLIGSSIDITERKNIEGRLKEQTALLEGLLDSIPDIVFFKDLEGTYLGCNTLFCELVGRHRSDVIGYTDYDFFPREDAEGFRRHDVLIQESGEECSTEEWLVFPEGKRILFDMLKAPLRDVAGRTIGLLGVGRDITDRKRIEAELVREKERVDNVIEGTNIGTWEWNVQTGETVFNERWAAIVGYTLDDLAPVSIKTWSDLVHPEDSMRSQKELERVFSQQLEFYDCECRMRHREGHWVWVHDRGKVLRWTDDGRPLIMYGTHMDISLRKEAEAAMLDARRLAEEASQAKSRFLANMSHEIRTPLNGVIGFADLMSRTRLDPLQDQYMKNIVHSANSLMDLINDILDFSKIEAGRMELDPEMISVSGLCEDTADFVKLAAHSKGLELVLLIDPLLPGQILVDPVRLRQILVNLLGNAVKFTERGAVTLEAGLVAREGDSVRVRFSVQDTGIGISEEQRKKLFTSFSQADPSTTRKYGGTGLGLAISQRLLEKMGSGLSLESSPGQGSRFSFELVTGSDGKTLPPVTGAEGVRLILVTHQAEVRQGVRSMLAGSGVHLVEAGSCGQLAALLDPANPPHLVMVDSRLAGGDVMDCIQSVMQRGVQDGLRFVVCLMHRSSEDPAIFSRAQSLGVRQYLVKPPKRSDLEGILETILDPERRTGEAIPSNEAVACPVADHQGVAVLIADDNEINCMLAHAVIEGILPGARIIEVNDGGSAVDAYREHRPDLVLMDVQMPVKDGYAATVEIRTWEETIARRAVIVALTAGTVKGERERCLMSGMDEYITKPFVAGTIESLIRRWLPGLIDKNPERVKEAVEVRRRFDRDALLARMAGDDEMYQRLLTEVPRVMPAYIADLHTAIAGEDEALIRKRAHRIKGAALGMSFGILARLGQELEMLDPWDMSRARLLGADLEKEFSAILSLVQRESGNPSA